MSSVVRNTNTGRRFRPFLLLGFAIIVLTGWRCDRIFRPAELHLSQDMFDSPAVEAQEEDHFQTERFNRRMPVHGAEQLEAFRGSGSGVRIPPEGTIPRETIPCPPDDCRQAGKKLVNPLQPVRSVLERGYRRYNIYCYPCHGATGHGDGPIIPRFPLPPPDLTKAGSNSARWADGKLFQLITFGRGAMKPFASAVGVKDRWSIILYIRLLQKTERLKADRRPQADRHPQADRRPQARYRLKSDGEP